MSHPTATGALQRTPLSHLLLYCLERKLRGTLCLSRTSLELGPQGLGEDRIRIVAGMVTAAATREPAIDLRDALVPLCARGHGNFGFFEGQDLMPPNEHILQGQLHPFSLLTAALRGPYREPVVSAVLDELGQQPVLVRERVRLEPFAFAPDEAELVHYLQRRPATVAELVGRGTHSRAVVRRVVYALRISRTLAVLPAGRRQESGTIAVPSATPATRPARPESKQQLRPVASEADLMEAASAYRRAKQALRQRRYADSVQLLKRACRLVPDEAEYLTMLAIATFELSGRRISATDKVIRLLEHAVSQDPSCEAAHYQLGVVHKHAGNHDAAIPHFRLAHQVNPRNIDAAREVRLHSLRRHRADSQGLWTRLVNSVAPTRNTGS